MPSQTAIHLWSPGMFGLKGGIQVYSTFLLKALQQLYPNLPIEVFLKNDMDISAPAEGSSTRFHSTGKYSEPIRTYRFGLQILATALWQAPQLIIAAHLNFSPVAYLLKRLTGQPYWVMAYGMEAWGIQRPLLKAALHHADRILAISHYTRDRLIQEQNLAPDKVVLLPCTFDAGAFQIAKKPDHLLKKYHLRPDQAVILTICRLAEAERYKGYDQILAALPLIQHAIPDIHYILVGKGNDQQRIEQLITERQLQDCVTLAGFIPDDQLGDYYNLCDVFAMPSKKEGFGIVYLEAMACGKPALGGNQDGAVDALCNGALGALVDPDDIDQIAQTLIEILKGIYPNPIVYQPEQLQQQVNQIYGFETFKQSLTGYLRSCVHSRQSQS